MADAGEAGASGAPTGFGSSQTVDPKAARPKTAKRKRDSEESIVFPAVGDSRTIGNASTALQCWAEKEYKNEDSFLARLREKRESLSSSAERWDLLEAVANQAEIHDKIREENSARLIEYMKETPEYTEFGDQRNKNL